MKCKFCGTNSETVVTRMNGMDLCEDCESIRAQREPKIVEVETPVNGEWHEAEAMPASDIKAEIVIGVKNDGSLYFNAGGSDVNLLMIDGLLKFAERRMLQIWAERDVRTEANTLDVDHS